MKAFKLHPEVHLPKRALTESVGYDVEAFLLTENGRPSHRVIPSQHVSSIPTGLVLLPPRGYILFVCSRSGLGALGVFVANSPGVIDPDYTGEIKILLFNGGWEPYHVKHGERIAQILIIPRPLTPELELITVLPETERGKRGFGSTGR